MTVNGVTFQVSFTDEGDFRLSVLNLPDTNQIKMTREQLDILGGAFITLARYKP